MMEHYLICDKSYGDYKSCDITDCPYHLEHYNPQPVDWIMMHKVNAINTGGCMQNLQERVNNLG
mgnify:FL=1|jgi:hypothetical protein